MQAWLFVIAYLCNTYTLDLPNYYPIFFFLFLFVCQKYFCSSVLRVCTCVSLLPWQPLICGHNERFSLLLLLVLATVVDFFPLLVPVAACPVQFIQRFLWEMRKWKHLHIQVHCCGKVLLLVIITLSFIVTHFQSRLLCMGCLCVHNSIGNNHCSNILLALLGIACSVDVHFHTHTLTLTHTRSHT